MKEGKHSKKKFRIIEAYSVLILIATLFISIGYAEITSVNMIVNGIVEAEVQTGVFITDIVNTNEEDESSKINYFIGTTMNSTVVLGDAATVSYEVTLYNNSNKDYIFVGVITDKRDTSQYSNENIEYTLNGLEKYVTTISHESPNNSLTFTITFKYKDGADTTNNNTLSSILNFKFQEIPKLNLDVDGQTYTLNDIYPDYTPQEYTFKVSNYDDTGINNVPMTYSFETTIASPLSAKIYNENNEEVTKEITIEGDGATKKDHTYTLKIIWDSNNPEENIDYNSLDYANQKFDCSIRLKAIPDDSIIDEYNGYTIEKGFKVDITTAPFNFNVNIANKDISIKNDLATLPITINNYSSEANVFTTSYDISIENNSDFAFNINGESPVNGVITKTLSGGSKLTDSFDIQFTADMTKIDLTETLTLKIVPKSPYVTEAQSYTINITFHTVTVTLDATGGTVNPSTITVYQTKTYADLPTPVWAGHTFNGWYSASSGGTKYETTTTVTTSDGAQTLYAQWTSHLLADNVKVGDYVDYEVYYKNVYTANSGTTHKAADNSTYTGWRVLDIVDSDDGKYVKLVSAGVPLTYVHSSSSGSSASVTNLTTGFFDTSINSTSTYQTFRLCGFKTSSTLATSVTTKAGLKALFNNDYTQTTTNGPAVRSILKAEIDKVWYGDADNDGVADGSSGNNTSFVGNDLIAILTEDQATTSSKYATYYTADKRDSSYLWCIYWQGIMVYTSYERGVRPVVSLKPSVQTTGKNDESKWELIMNEF